MRRRFAIAMVCTLAVAWPLSERRAFAADGAAPSEFASQVAHTVCAIGCTSVGTQSVAEGNKNSQEGQSTQNMMQMAQGAMQIAQGLLGIMAGMQGAQKAAQSGENGSGLSSLGNNPIGPGGTSPTPNGTNGGGGDTSGSTQTGNISAGGTTSSPIGFSASQLRTGIVGEAMNNIEKNYGIDRDQFAAALQRGVSPQDILSHAPKNAPSLDSLNSIAEKLNASNTAGKDIADRLLASVNAGGAGTGSVGDGSVNLGTASTEKKASGSAADGEIDELVPTGDVSPEVKAAMAAKAAQLKAEKEMREMHGWNIFQLVHSRYQKLETMLYGRVDRTNASPTAGQRGF